MFFFGSALLAVAVGVLAVPPDRTTLSWYLLAGAVVGVLAVVVTVAFNVPLNNHLHGIDLAGLGVSRAAAEWQGYFSTWTAWNHVRTATGFHRCGTDDSSLRAL